MKLSICGTSFNNEEYIDMYLDGALKIADEVVITDGGSTDLTVPIIKQFQLEHSEGSKIKLINGPEVKPEVYQFQIKDKYSRIIHNANLGLAKNISLENATGDYVLFLDTDEVISDNAREILEKAVIALPDTKAFHIEYIHFIHDFRHIDNSVPIHMGLFRLHKRIPELNYGNTYNHAVLRGIGLEDIFLIPNIFIFHLGYARNLFDIHKRYYRNMVYSEIHTKLHQECWKSWHYNNYPKKEVNIYDIIPMAIKRRFDIHE